MLVQQEKPTMVVVQVLKYGLPPHRTDTHSPFNRGRRGVFYLLEDSQKDLYIARHRRKTDVLQLQEGDVIPGVIIHRSDLLRFALPREWNLHRYRRTAFANACRRATSRSFFQCSFPSISSTAEVLYVHEVSTPAGKQRVLVCKELDGTEAAVACNENLLRILQSPKYSQQPRILVQFKNTIHETVQLDLRGRGIFAVQRPLRLFKPYGVRPALRVPLRINPDHRQPMYATACAFYNNRAWLYLSRNKAHAALSLTDLHHCALLPCKYSTKAIKYLVSRSGPVTVRPYRHYPYQFIPHYQDARVMVRTQVWRIVDSPKTDASTPPSSNLSYETRSGYSNSRDARSSGSYIRNDSREDNFARTRPTPPSDYSSDDRRNGVWNQERISSNSPLHHARPVFRQARATSSLPYRPDSRPQVDPRQPHYADSSAYAAGPYPRATHPFPPYPANLPQAPFHPYHPHHAMYDPHYRGQYDGTRDRYAPAHGSQNYHGHQWNERSMYGASARQQQPIYGAASVPPQPIPPLPTRATAQFAMQGHQPSMPQNTEHYRGPDNTTGEFLSVRLPYQAYWSTPREERKRTVRRESDVEYDSRTDVTSRSPQDSTMDSRSGSSRSPDRRAVRQQQSAAQRVAQPIYVAPGYGPPPHGYWPSWSGYEYGHGYPSHTAPQGVVVDKRREEDYRTSLAGKTESWRARAASEAIRARQLPTIAEEASRAPYGSRVNEAGPSGRRSRTHHTRA